MDKRIFIGSSSEALAVARELQAILGEDGEHIVDLWTDSFDIGSIVLDSLLQKCTKYDFAIFIFQPDDITHIRDKTRQTVRDNVIFEAGVFMKALGRSRVFLLKPVIVENGLDVHILTDIAGLVYATYAFPNDRKDLRARLTPVCHKLQKQFREAAPSARHSRLTALAGQWSGKILQPKGTEFEEFEVEAEFEVSGETITAHFILRGSLFVGVREAKLIAHGDFVSTNFVKLDYRYLDLEQTFDFGTLILGLQSQGSILIGKYAGYGPFTDKIVYGDMKLTRHVAR